MLADWCNREKHTQKHDGERSTATSKSWDSNGRVRWCPAHPAPMAPVCRQGQPPHPPGGFLRAPLYCG